MEDAQEANEARGVAPFKLRAACGRQQNEEEASLGARRRAGRARTLPNDRPRHAAVPLPTPAISHILLVLLRRRCRCLCCVPQLP